MKWVNVEQSTVDRDKISIVHLLFKRKFDNYSTNNELCGKPLKFLCGVYVSNDEI